jgi:two-component system, OmpR family, alkaline phosphatase synthesis response regulator PhoP
MVGFAYSLNQKEFPMVQKKRILLIEDEEDIAALIKLQAEISGYKLHVEVDGVNGYKAIEREKPDLVILDIMLPGQNGFDVCRKIKSNPDLRHIPVIILSAKEEEIDVLLGLELGADDYVAKPFSPKILFSRIKAVLRRSKESEKSPDLLTFGNYILEVDRYLLRTDNKIIPLTLSEFGILRRLLANRGKVLTRNQLLDDVHNDDAFIVDRNIDVHIAALRKKLGPNFNWIETVRGIGYRFKEEDAVLYETQGV